MYRRFAAALVITTGWHSLAVAHQAQTATKGTSQASTSTTTDISDIVVTALKRNESALDAPATITMLTSEALAAKNVVAANQFNGIIPGLAQSVGVAALPGTSFRGLGSTSAVFSLEPSVAQYQDGVYLGHVRDFVSPLYDVDHIEFIKGTQSTLLGKNTSLGAISVVNKRPSKNLGYDVQLSHSFRIDGNAAQGAVNVPLSEVLRVRGAFLLSRENGYIDNIYKDRSEARQTDISGRLMIAFEPNDGFDGLLIYQHDDRRVRGQTMQVVIDPTNTVENRAAAVGVPFNAGAVGVSTSASDALGGTPEGVEPFDRQNTDRVNLIMNANIGEHVLTSQTSYSQWGSTRATDLDFTAANLFNIIDGERNKALTQEVRLSSPSGERLTYLVGAFYYFNRWRYDRAFQGAPSNTVAFPLTGAAVSATSLSTKAISAFASATFEMVPEFKIDAGLRYTRERKAGTFVRNSTGTLAASFGTIPFTIYEPQVTHPLDYNLGVRYEPSSNVLIYASYSKGTKSGGYQDAPTTVATAAFNQERAYSAELGAKIRLDNGHLTAALFNTRVKGLQTGYTALVGGVSQPAIGNSEVRSRGVEAHLSYRLIPELRIGGTIVYADSIFLDPFPANASIARPGDRLQRAPKWTGSAEADYTAPINDTLTGFANFSANFTSKVLYQFVVPQPNAPFGPSRTIIDGRIGIRGGDQNQWELAIIGTNLTNRRFIEFATGVSAGGGAYYGSFNRPRVIAVQLKLKG